MIIDLVEDLQTNLKNWQQRDINYFDEKIFEVNKKNNFTN